MSNNKVYEMVACVHCNGQYKDHWKAKEVHARECEGTANELKEAKDKKVSNPPVTKTKTENQGGTEAKVGNEPEIKDEEARKLYEIGKQSLESRQKAPEMYVTGVHTDERTEIVKRYAKECVNPPYNPKQGKKRKFAAWHAYWGDGARDKMLITAHRGYIPIIDEHGKQVTHKGDVLWKLPTKMYLDSKFAASAESASRRRVQEDEEAKQLRKDIETAGGGIDTEHWKEQIE